MLLLLLLLLLILLLLLLLYWVFGLMEKEKRTMKEEK